MLLIAFEELEQSVVTGLSRQSDLLGISRMSARNCEAWKNPSQEGTRPLSLPKTGGSRGPRNLKWVHLVAQEEEIQVQLC